MALVSRSLPVYQTIAHTTHLVDKIVIDEAGVKPFVNNLQTGAYKTLSSVDFAALDRERLELVGVYGSKSEIARFFLSQGHINSAT